MPALLGLMTLLAVGAPAWADMGDLCGLANAWGGGGDCPAAFSAGERESSREEREPSCDAACERAREESRAQAVENMPELAEEKPWAPDLAAEAAYSLDLAERGDVGETTELYAAHAARFAAPELRPYAQAPPHAEPAPHTCPDERLRELEAARDTACAAPPRDCREVPNGDCVELKKRRLAALRCAKARNTLKVECRGGRESPAEESASDAVDQVLRPCGKRVSDECCSKSLKKAKDNACHRNQVLDCKGTRPGDCDGIKRIMEDIAACAAARELLRDHCYDGEDDLPHESFLKSLIGNLDFCRTLLAGSCP